MPDYPLITLLTDLGISDPYVGIMKGIIADIAPAARVIDLTHMITPQNIREGSLELDRAYQYFPAGTIHLAVVDPGVGTKRHAMAMRAGQYLFVGPDNGLFSFVIKREKAYQRPIKAVRLDNPRYRLEPVSPVFHGRDLFAPAAAYLAAGAALESFGNEIENPVVINLPQPESTSRGWLGEIWAVDHFGSLETNMESKLLMGVETKMIRIKIGGRIIEHWVSTFADGTPGELVAMINSTGRLCISVVNGSAARELNAGVCTPVELLLGFNS